MPRERLAGLLGMVATALRRQRLFRRRAARAEQNGSRSYFARARVANHEAVAQRRPGLRDRKEYLRVGVAGRAVSRGRARRCGARNGDVLSGRCRVTLTMITQRQLLFAAIHKYCQGCRPPFGGFLTIGPIALGFGLGLGRLTIGGIAVGAWLGFGGLAVRGTTI